MNLHLFIAKAEKVVTDNSPLILTAVGVAGTLTTAYLTGKASIKASDILREQEAHKLVIDQAPLTKQEKVLLTWTLYLPAAGSATMTIAAIILANRIGTRRTAVLAAAYAAGDKAFSEYKDAVAEKFTPKKEKEIRDEINQRKLDQIQTGHIVLGQGEILMLDSYTMRPFTSTMEKVRKVENDMRELMLNGEKTVSCSDWLKGIGLRTTPYSDDFGWNTESGFKLDYTPGQSDDGRPCFIWHFVIEPQYRPEPTADRFHH